MTPNPSDDLLREQAYLVERGVRPMALVDGDRTVHDLLRVGGTRAVPFAVREGVSGYASHAWVVDLLRWADTAPAIQRDRIVGLLLGYCPDAIRRFEELGVTVGPFEQKEASCEQVPPQQPVPKMRSDRGEGQVPPAGSGQMCSTRPRRAYASDLPNLWVRMGGSAARRLARFTNALVPTADNAHYVKLIRAPVPSWDNAPRRATKT